MLKRRGLFIAGVVVLIVATVSQVERVLAKSSAGYVYYGSAPRCTSLVLGIFMALLVDRLPRITAGTRFLLIFAGLAGWIVASTNDSDFNGPAKSAYGVRTGRLSRSQPGRFSTGASTVVAS